MYVLLLVTTQAFLGQYKTLDSCNQAIRAIIEKQTITTTMGLTKAQIQEMQKVVDLRLQYQHDYVCVKQ